MLIGSKCTTRHGKRRKGRRAHAGERTLRMPPGILTILFNWVLSLHHRRLEGERVLRGLGRGQRLGSVELIVGGGGETGVPSPRSSAMSGFKGRRLPTDVIG